MLIPLLRKMYKMMSFHLGLFDKLPAKADGEIQWIEGFKFQRPCDFTMMASSNMLSKANLMQIFPFVTQYLLSGPLMEALKSTGQSVDFAELLRMLQDAAGTKGRYDLIRQMTPEEQQAAQQPPPEVVQQQQMEDKKHQNAKEIMGMKISGDIEQTKISSQGSPEEIQMKMQEAQQKMQLEQMKAMMKMEMDKQKLEFEKQMAQLKLQVEQKTGEMKVQTGQQKMVMDQQSNQMKMEQQEQQGAIDLQTAMMSSQQQLRQGEEAHKQGLQQTKEMGAVKTETMKANAAAKTTSAGKPRKKAEVRKKKKAE